MVEGGAELKLSGQVAARHSPRDPAMARYTLRVLDGARRLTGRYEFSAPTDEEAQQAARIVIGDRRGELICAGRRVAAFTGSSLSISRA